MPSTPIYLDNHATTRVDPRVVAAMLPYFSEHYGNAASVTHEFGKTAQAAVDSARETIARAIHAEPREIIFTSGATESNNLALFGVAERERRRGKHIVSVLTEHKAVLDPLRRLERQGFEITLLPVASQDQPDAGAIDLAQLTAALREDTCLVSVMLANNEIGILQPIAEIGQLCRARGILLHCDATQAVGKMPVDVATLQVDLLSFSAHKMYGPKGIGALYVKRRSPQVRLEPRVWGGGHEQGLRSGTLNVPGIVGLATALELCLAELESERERLARLRWQLWTGLQQAVPNLQLNGPEFTAESTRWRLPGNLNFRLGDIDGQTLLLNLPELALSSGAACSSVTPEPSHVLRALGLSEDQCRSSLRFGLGRFTTSEEIEASVHILSETIFRLRKWGA
jgi:cysteine desulfurase